MRESNDKFTFNRNLLQFLIDTTQSTILKCVPEHVHTFLAHVFTRK